MLRKLRIALAAFFLAAATLMFLGWGHEWFGWIAALQFLPSCIALNFLTIGIVVALTVLFGRVYCSVICPLGVWQDLLIRLFWKRKGRFEYSRGPVWLRYVILVLFVVALVADIQFVIYLLAPYSSYGQAVGTLAALISGKPWLTAAALGSVSLVLVSACAVMWGRIWCNTVCPVGTVLGLIGRAPVFRINIDKDKCNGCRVCARKCKSSCIDPVNHKVDYTRCVTCFDCVDNCRQGAIGFGFRTSGKPGKSGTSGTTGPGRREFLSTTAAVVAAASLPGKLLAADGVQTDGGLSPLEPKKSPVRAEHIVPFGARSAKNFYTRCTGCQLCVSSCPNDVLRPRTDLEHLLQPEVGFEDGYCRPECNVCSQVCPAGAILPIDRDAKFNIHIGTARVDLKACVVNTDGVECGNCARHCPVGAIRMLPGEDGRARPAVNEDMCIGCGACENLCPVRPVSAITVDGLSIHR